MTALVVSVFVSALLGSVHCAGMCGGLACFVAGSADARATAAYNGGGALSALARGGGPGAGGGGVAGAAGAGFDRVGMIAGIARPAAIVAGFLMIVWGGATAVAAAGARVAVLSTPAGARRGVAP